MLSQPTSAPESPALNVGSLYLARRAPKSAEVGAPISWLVGNWCTECLIGQSFADEDLAIILMVFELEKFLKFLFQSVRPFLCCISDHVEPMSGRRGEIFFKLQLVVELYLLTLPTKMPTADRRLHVAH